MDGDNRRFKAVLAAQLNEVEHRGLYRRLRSVSGAQDGVVMLDGHEVLLLSSNNYLGLANHPALKRAAQEASRKVALLNRRGGRCSTASAVYSHGVNFS